jgi:hypothetical protein
MQRPPAPSNATELLPSAKTIAACSKTAATVISQILVRTTKNNDCRTNDRLRVPRFPAVFSLYRAASRVACWLVAPGGPALSFRSACAVPPSVGRRAVLHLYFVLFSGDDL